MKPTINALVNVYKNISRCNYCGVLKSSKDECDGFNNCSYLQKKFSKICVVETIGDQWSIESTNIFMVISIFLVGLFLDHWIKIKNC